MDLVIDSVSHTHELPGFLVTQAVERAVKLVTESAQNVCGSIAREGYIRAKIDSRENMPKFDLKKKQFNVSMK